LHQLDALATAATTLKLLQLQPKPRATKKRKKKERNNQLEKKKTPGTEIADLTTKVLAFKWLLSLVPEFWRSLDQ